MTDDKRNNEFAGNISINKLLGLNRVIIQIGQPIDDMTNNKSIEDILLGQVELTTNKPLLINKALLKFNTSILLIVIKTKNLMYKGNDMETNKDLALQIATRIGNKDIDAFNDLENNLPGALDLQ